MYPELLTLETVKAAALKAYREGKLTAQGDSPRPCVNIDARTGRRCPIGWAISESLARTHPTRSFSFLLARGLVKISTGSWMEDDHIREIQWAHDLWCKAKGPEARKDREAQFVRLIDGEAAAHPRAAWPDPKA